MPETDLVESATDVRYDGDQRLTRLRGSFELPRTDGSGDAAQDPVRTFLTDHADELQLPGDERGLELVQTAQLPTGRVLRYQQRVQGLPVFGTEVVVTLDNDRRVTQVDLNREPRPEVRSRVSDGGGDGGSDLTADQAREAALASIPDGVTLRGDIPGPNQVMYPHRDGLRRAWIVLVPTRQPAHDWQVVVDAETGEVLERRDVLARQDGSGLVFDPSPVVSAGDTTLRDPDATTASCGFAGPSRATIDAQRVSRPLRDITRDAAGVYRLEGPFVRMHNFGSPTSAFPAETDPNAFTYSSGDERFECVTLYHHIDTYQRYLQSIGITTAHNSRIDVDPHEGTGPAFFSPADGGLHFSDSGPCRPDRAEDADCFIHEYGHAIQHDQVPTWGGTNPVTGRDETGAMGEGFGDASACIYYADRGNGYQREVFEEWIFADQGGLRRVDGTKVYPTDWAGEVHEDGEIWSAALWNIYRAVGGDSVNAADREAARRAVLKSVILSHHRLLGNASMPDGAEAVMVENAALEEYRGRHLMAMLDSFHDRGLLVCSPQADLYIRDGVTDAGTDPYTGPAFWESPDLWIRNTDDGGTTHQNPEYGQDNFFYCRVTNRGTATARAFVVTFAVKIFAGTEFVYPNDWLPPVSAAVGFNLAPGASTVVKAKWPGSLVPASGAQACWLAQVYTPSDPTPAGRHVWESNNLAEKNLTVVDLRPNDAAIVDVHLGALSRLHGEEFRIEVHRPERFRTTPVSLVTERPEVLRRLFTSIEQVPVTTRPELVGIARPPVEVPAGRSTTVIVGDAPSEAWSEARHADAGGDSGTRRAGAPNATSDGAELHLADRGGAAVVFRPGPLSGFPVVLPARTSISVGVKVGVPSEAHAGDSFDVDLVQRNTDGAVVGGIRIRVNVVE
jgi:hypothetical protein